MRDRISKGFKYQELTQEEASALLATGDGTGYTPRGSFVVKEGSGYTAIDNRDGHAWTEDFKGLSGAVAYLKGN